MSCLRPPFHGKDLDQLYRSVQRGNIEPIPKMFSRELDHLIRQCLRQKATDRPTAEELLLPDSSIVTKCEYYGIDVDCEQQDNPKEQLLKTIKMPFDIKKLNSQLPSSNYEKGDETDHIDDY